MNKVVIYIFPSRRIIKINAVQKIGWKRYIHEQLQTLLHGYISDSKSKVNEIIDKINFKKQIKVEHLRKKSSNKDE